MKRLVTLIGAVIYLFVALQNPVTIYANSLPDNEISADSFTISAASAILIEAQSGTILYEKNAYEKREIASTTKIMTTLLTLESGNLDEYFVIDPSAAKVEGTSMGLLKGDKVTKRILSYGMMLPSGNDAANAAAIKISESLPKFAELMNKRAREIGMKNTNFVTPSGLDDYTDDHKSTAYDMSLLTREALKNPLFAEICSSQTAKVSYGNPVYDRWLKNSNKMLANYPDSIGVKTGFTDKAKRCLVSAAERDGVKLIVVTLNAPDDWADHTKLLDYGFSVSKNSKLDSDEKKIIANVVGGKKDTVVITPLSNSSVVKYENQNNEEIEASIILPHFTYAPIQKGERIGLIEYKVKGEVVASSPLVAESDIEFKTQKAFGKSIIDTIKRKFAKIFK